MAKRNSSKVHVKVDVLNVFQVFRDVVHQRADAEVNVDKLNAEGVGGDVINAKSVAPAPRRKRPRSKRRLARKAITHGLITIAGIGGSVIVAGVTYAFGWA
jgi:hypothetical protein